MNLDNKKKATPLMEYKFPKKNILLHYIFLDYLL